MEPLALTVAQKQQIENYKKLTGFAASIIEQKNLLNQKLSNDILLVCEGDGNTFFPMYQVNIMASNYTMQKEYNEPGIYVSNAIVDKLRVNLYRVVKNADGSFSETTMDQLINREENSTSDGLVIDTISTTNRKTEVILVLKKAISNVNNITVRYSDKMIFKKDETSDLLMKH